MNIRMFFLGILLSWVGFSVEAQKADCEKIAVEVEVDQENTQAVLKIRIEENGTYKIRLIDSKGNVNVFTERNIRNLKKGEYDIVIVDEANINRCPFSKRIKI